MNEFEIYLREGKVKGKTPDFELSKSLIKDSKSRLEKIKRLDIKEFSKIIFENAYDAVRDALDALLAADGYKSAKAFRKMTLKRYSIFAGNTWKK